MSERDTEPTPDVVIDATSDGQLVRTGADAHLPTTPPAPSLARRVEPEAKPEPLRRIDQIMEIAALALLPIGLTALVLGWMGMASHGHVFLQLPYLVSGGLLGLALVVLSGLLYLASWISRASTVQRRQNEAILDVLTSLQRTIAAGGSGGGNSSNGHAISFVATPSGSMFHRPDCAVVSSRDDLSEVDAVSKGMKPCGMCEPLGTDTDLTQVAHSAN